MQMETKIKSINMTPEPIGKIIAGRMISKGIDKIPGIKADVMLLIETDQMYTNCIPIKLFKNLIQMLDISVEEAEPAMYVTFEKLDADTNRKREPWAYLWENSESLGKYIKRLKELINEDSQ